MTMVLTLTIRPRFLESLDRLDLSFQQGRGGIHAAKGHFTQPHPAIDAGSYFRIDGVDRDGDVGDARIGDFVQVIGQGQTVGGQT